jgi:hypothetical protein
VDFGWVLSLWVYTCHTNLKVPFIFILWILVVWLYMCSNWQVLSWSELITSSIIFELLWWKTWNEHCYDALHIFYISFFYSLISKAFYLSVWRCWIRNFWLIGQYYVYKWYHFLKKLLEIIYIKNISIIRDKIVW